MIENACIFFYHFILNKTVFHLHPKIFYQVSDHKSTIISTSALILALFILEVIISLKWAFYFKYSSRYPIDIWEPLWNNIHKTCDTNISKQESLVRIISIADFFPKELVAYAYAMALMGTRRADLKSYLFLLIICKIYVSVILQLLQLQ